MRPLAAFFLFFLLACSSSPADVNPDPIPAVASMTLDEKIGQLVVVGADGMFMNEQSPGFQRLLRLVRERHVSGVIWYSSGVMELAWMSNRLQEAAEIPLLIVADLEAGIGMRFPDATFFPWAMAVAATGDLALAEAAASATAEQALLVGINQIYAPVADVNNNPDNPVINVRSFGEDPESVADFVAATIRGIQSQGALATAKHFPGHGDTTTDSHRSLAVLEASRERIESLELIPFRAAIESGVAAIMPAHLSVPSLDPTPAPVRGVPQKNNPYHVDEAEVTRSGTWPASLSRPIIEGILRGELGYRGLIVADALDMGGIGHHFETGEAAVRAIEAGNDQVLKPADPDRAIDALKTAVIEGRLSEARIDASVERILAAKRRIKAVPYDPAAIFRSFDSPEYRQLGAEIASKALTLVREKEGTLPLRRDARLVHLLVGDFQEARSPITAFSSALSSLLATPPVHFAIDRRTPESEIPAILESIAAADRVLVSFTVRARSGEGRVSVPPVALQLFEKIASLEKVPPLIGVSFGTPYLLRDVPSLDTFIAAYGPQPLMQRAAARALFGETAMTGRLPVTIPGVVARGFGIMKPAIPRSSTTP
ncbi:MAG TPA: glycoside hydrolase family 3 N-terminal domain-containing protein [Thermoanaerobaculia bacterium]|nr:glycoside hydrolase family 3 N-terminal domain-containing protein [Thermoanaerobaculia bacterium]